MIEKVGNYTVLRFKSLPSTNDYAKSLEENSFVLATTQTGGRGTKGRSFSSAEGGIYLTKLSFEGMPAKDAFLIMARAAVSVCKTLERFALKPLIKWANDVYVNDKKICGILIENRLNGKEVASSIVGVGLNVNNVLPDDLKPIAISMREALKDEVDFQAVEKALLEELTKPYTIDEYIKRVGYLNRKVLLIEGEKQTRVIPLYVEEDGSLVVDEDGKIRKVAAAEVSLSVREEKCESC